MDTSFLPAGKEIKVREFFCQVDRVPGPIGSRDGFFRRGAVRFPPPPPRMSDFSYHSPPIDSSLPEASSPLHT